MSPVKIGSFETQEWGQVDVLRATYERADGPTAVILECGGEPFTKLSINMYRPACSHDSKDLPAGCFYVKTWSENEDIAARAFASGLFVLREDLPRASSGFASAPVWQIKGSTS